MGTVAHISHMALEAMLQLLLVDGLDHILYTTLHEILESRIIINHFRVIVTSGMVKNLLMLPCHESVK